MTYLLSLYKWLLLNAMTVSEGLLFTLKSQTAFENQVILVFVVKLILMIFGDDSQLSLTWNVKAPYLAIREDEM